MAGAISSLPAMIAHMAPRLDPQDYCFCVAEAGRGFDIDAALATFREDEGLTLVLPLANAQAAGLAGPPFRRIILQVHSALDGVGLTATVSAALAEAQIPCNVIAAFHHDHIFVPADMAEKALQVLGELAKTGGVSGGA